MPLPPNATTRSHELLPLAQELAELCTQSIGAEAALAGSVARGWADEFSDIELNFWTDEIDPWPGERLAWLQSIGAGPIRVHPEVHQTGSRWIDFHYKGVLIEAGWHSFATCEAVLKRILAGEVTDMFEGYLAESLAHAVPLRGGEHLQRWQTWLETYPDALRRTMIEGGVDRWRVSHLELDAGFILRPDPAAVVGRMDLSLRAVLRTLFAINRQWEPDLRKWIRRWSEPLAIKPEHLADRIHALYARPLETASYTDYIALIAETLDLVPPEYDVADVRETVAAVRANWAGRLRR
jgi:hypothetical protein